MGELLMDKLVIKKFYPRVATKHCWKRGMRHDWSPYTWEWSNHWWKVCKTCNARRRTHHVDCDVRCMGGLG